jgi:hypothetical protein
MAHPLVTPFSNGRLKFKHVFETGVGLKEGDCVISPDLERSEFTGSTKETKPRRFPQPWSIGEQTPCFIAKDALGRRRAGGDPLDLTRHG